MFFTKTEFEKLFSKLSNTPCHFSDVTSNQQSYKDDAYYAKLKKDIYNRELARKSLLEEKMVYYIFDEYHGQEDYKKLARGLKLIIDGADEYKGSDKTYFVIVNNPEGKIIDKECEHDFSVHTNVENFLLARVIGNLKKDKSGSFYRRFRIDDMPRLYENCVSFYRNLMRTSEIESRETYKELQYKLSETNKILSDFDNYFYEEYGYK